MVVQAELVRPPCVDLGEKGWFLQQRALTEHVAEIIVHGLEGARAPWGKRELNGRTGV